MKGKQLARLLQGLDVARAQLIGVMDALGPIAEGTPGLPDQLARLEVAVDRFDDATTRFQKLVDQGDRNGR